MTDAEVSRTAALVGKLTQDVASIGAEVDTLKAAKDQVQGVLNGDDEASLKNANDLLETAIGNIESKIATVSATVAGATAPASGMASSGA